MTMTPDIGKMRSKIMSSVRSKGNKSTEMRFIDYLISWSIVGWRRHHNVFGKPDFAFPKKRVVVFIDGCFWHGCPKHCRLPATNVQYWESKIDGNVLRDRRVTRELKKRGWIVFRFWEHELKGYASLTRKLNFLKKTLLLRFVSPAG